MADVKKAFSGAKKIYHLDGLSVQYDNWWLNLRPSNTEPLLRLNLEADSAKLRDEMKEKVIGILEK